MKFTLDSQLAVREYLRAKYHRMKAKNQAYSMRAFARDLGISSAALSEIFHGKRSVSKKKALQLLGLADASLQDIEQISELFDNHKRLKQYIPQKTLRDDAHELLGNWLHFAILALLETKDFRSDLSWIAKRFQTDRVTIVKCIDRLLRHNLIRVTHNGRYLHTGIQYESVDGTSNDAIQQSHRNHLKLAEQALGKVSLDKRNFSQITMAIDPKRLSQAHKIILDFERKMSALLEKGTKKEVYHLGIQLFPVSFETVSHS